MTHSVIIKVGETLVYQCSPHVKPTTETSSSPVEFNRALPEWENTSKSYLIKKEDMGAFQDFMIKDGINVGIAIPQDDIEIYDDEFKKYARYKKGGGNAGVQGEQNVKSNTMPQNNQQPNGTHGCYCRTQCIKRIL